MPRTTDSRHLNRDVRKSSRKRSRNGFRDGFAYYARGLYREFVNKTVFLYAQAIAFKALITFVPLVILATGIAGNVMQRERPFSYVEALVRDFLPSYQSEQLMGFVSQLQEASGTLTIIGLGGLAITAITLFTTLRIILSQIFKEEWHRQRSILGGYAFDFRMALQVGLIFTISIAATLVFQGLDASWGVVQRVLGSESIWLEQGWHNVFEWTSVLLPFLLSFAMFFMLFYFVPIPRPPKRSVAIGATVTAILWEAAKYAFAFYATRIGYFDRSWLSALGETFSIVIFIVFWAYYSGMVLIIGALVTLLHERRHRIHLKAISSDGSEFEVDTASGSVTAREMNDA